MAICIDAKYKGCVDATYTVVERQSTPCIHHFFICERGLIVLYACSVTYVWVITIYMLMVLSYNVILYRKYFCRNKIDFTIKYHERFVCHYNGL